MHLTRFVDFAQCNATDLERCLTAAAVRHLSKSVALHCAKSTNLVRCNSLHPVFTRTAMVQSMIDSAPERNIEQKLIQQIPIRRLAELSESPYRNLLNKFLLYISLWC